MSSKSKVAPLPPISVRPTPTVRDRITYATGLGLSESGFVNEYIDDDELYRKFIEKLKKKINQTLAAPVP